MIRCWLIPLTLAVLAGSVTAEDIGLYLWTLGEQQLAAGTQLSDAPLLAELTVRDAAKTAALLRQHSTLTPTVVGQTTLRVRSRSDDSSAKAPGEEDLRASFVVDFEEPQVVELLAQVGADHSPEALRRFVFQHISDKHYGRAFDIASRVAASAAGDCTEHATLLAALARAHGYPARVVFGIVANESDSRVQFFGHAWTEIHQHGQWQRMDATVPPQPPANQRMRYFPIVPLRNEGPGYMMDAIQRATIWPQRVHLLNPDTH